jgi:hypothetical protein
MSLVDDAKSQVADFTATMGFCRQTTQSVVEFATNAALVRLKNILSRFPHIGISILDVLGVSNVWRI